MSRTHFIGLDTHCEFTEMVVLSSTGRMVKRDRCVTSIPCLVEMLAAVSGCNRVTFEEGPLADWLARNLRPHVAELIVAEPRRNALIAKEGDKDDPLDAERLAQLLRGGYVRPVHQAGSLERSLLKQHVAFYHDRVRERVRQGHQLTALLRRHGVFASIRQVQDERQRAALWKALPASRVLRADLEYLLAVHQLLCEQEAEIRLSLVRLARLQEPVRRLVSVPGIGWIRAATFYVYLDTPHRFAKKTQLWKYCGIGLQRRHSGHSLTLVQVSHCGNRRLKDVLLGAARSAIAAGDNPWAAKYQHWTKEEGMHRSTARRNVARAIASTLWSLWKHGSRYDSEWAPGQKRSSMPVERSPRH